MGRLGAGVAKKVAGSATLVAFPQIGMRYDIENVEKKKCSNMILERGKVCTGSFGVHKTLFLSSWWRIWPFLTTFANAVK